jgi:hypothetical protein
MKLQTMDNQNLDPILQEKIERYSMLKDEAVESENYD